MFIPGLIPCRRRRSSVHPPARSRSLAPIQSSFLVLLFCAAIMVPQPSWAQLPSDTHDTFVLSGTVVNSVTGEAISRALVRATGQVSRATFTDSEGHFQFEGLPPVQIILSVQKPGYVSDQDTGGPSLTRIVVGPSTGPQTLKLQPLSAISGRVTDASGQPIERIAVRLICRNLRDGRRIWEPRGMIETDEDGHFRFANLMPDTYYLSVGPAQSQDRILPEGEKPTTGFPHVYYPGVPDLASAAPIQLAAGQQWQADLSLNAVPVYHVAGIVSGQPPEHGVGLMTFSSSGDDLMLPARVNSETGTFSLDNVPAGSYVLKALSNGEAQQLRAEQRISVAGNLDNVHLALAPAISIPIVVHMQSRATSGAGYAAAGLNAGPWSESRPPLNVALLPTQPNANESFSTFQHGANGRVMVMQNVEPGTYTVNLLPQSPWYIQSATYGQTNALSDDITVAPGQSYPLEISLRDDAASLRVTVKGLTGLDTASDERADVIIIPQPASKLPPHVLRGVTNTYTEMGLAPGDYLIFAFDRIDGLEYTNPDALSSYASQAAHVTLSANQQGQVLLDLIRVGKGE
jgi:Carboxypeptidase regulatory-like domain